MLSGGEVTAKTKWLSFETWCLDLVCMEKGWRLLSLSYLSNFPVYHFHTDSYICLLFQQIHTDIHLDKGCLHMGCSVLDTFHLQNGGGK